MSLAILPHVRLVVNLSSNFCVVCKSERLSPQCCIPSFHIFLCLFSLVISLCFTCRAYSRPCIGSVANDIILLVKSDRAQNEQKVTGSLFFRIRLNYIDIHENSYFPMLEAVGSRQPDSAGPYRIDCIKSYASVAKKLRISPSKSKKSLRYSSSLLLSFSNFFLTFSRISALA